jgi:hypothetical protein
VRHPELRERFDLRAIRPDIEDPLLNVRPAVPHRKIWQQNQTDSFEPTSVFNNQQFYSIHRTALHLKMSAAAFKRTQTFRQTT